MSSNSAGSLLLGIGGAFVGGFVGMPALGFALGSSLGSALFPGQLPTVEGPRLEDTKVMSSAYGSPIPKVYGTNRVNGNLIWSGGITEHRQETTQGGKGGPSQTQVTYRYTASFAVALCEGPVRGIGRVWADGKLLTNNRFDLAEDQEGAGTDGFFRVVVDTIVSAFAGIGATYYTYYLGTDTQEVDPTIEIYEGANNTPAYRGLVYIVFNEMLLTKFGNRIPSITAEIIGEGSSTLDQISVIREATGTNPVEYDTSSVIDGKPLYVLRDNDLVKVFRWDSGTGYIDYYDTGNNYISTEEGRSFGYYWDSCVDERFNEGAEPFQIIGTLYHYSTDQWLQIYAANAGTHIGDRQIPTTWPLNPSGSDWSTYPYVRMGRYFGAGAPGNSLRNIIEDFPAEAGNYFHGCCFDPTGIYMMLFFGDLPSKNSSVNESERWYLCEAKDLYYLRTLDSGTIDHSDNPDTDASARSWIGMGFYNYMGQALDRDIRTFWFYSKQRNETIVYKINPLTKVMEYVDKEDSLLSFSGFRWTPMVADGSVLWLWSSDDRAVMTLADTGDHVPITLGDIVKDVCQSVGISLSDIDTTDIDAVDVDGMVRDRMMTARAVLELLQRAFFFEAVESDFNLKFTLRANTATDSISADDLYSSIKTIRSEDTTLPLSVVVKYHNMNANHQINSQQAKRIE